MLLCCYYAYRRLRLFVSIVVVNKSVTRGFLSSLKSILVLASVIFLLSVCFFSMLVFAFSIVLVLFVSRENGHINVQIWGLLDFLLAFTSSLYLCCHLTLSLSLRWCDVCDSSSVVGNKAYSTSFRN